jgi:hypothetical protein
MASKLEVSNVSLVFHSFLMTISMFHFQLITVLLHGTIHSKENQGCTHLHLM